MTTELLECLEDWGKHFIETRNPAGLAVLRAKTTIKNQSDRIGELLEAVERGNECREMLAAERALADRLAKQLEPLAWLAGFDKPNEAESAVTAWKEARK